MDHLILEESAHQPPLSIMIMEQTTVVAVTAVAGTIAELTTLQILALKKFQMQSGYTTICLNTIKPL